MKHLRSLLFSILFLGLSLQGLVSCKSGVPKDVLSMSKMEDVLYDYHLAQAIASQAPADSVDFYTRLYQSAVFDKYHITKADFDHSMEWYERHTTSFQKIYDHLTERYGGKVNDDDYPDFINRSDALMAGGDTLQLWKGPSQTMLSSSGRNYFVYEQKVDTALQADDVLQWRFNVDWFYREGEHRAVVLMTIHYEGDSIATQQQFVYGSGSELVTCRIAHRKVTRVECMMYQCAPWADRARIISLTQIRLYRMRHKKEKEEKKPSDAHNPDSTEKPNLVAPNLRIRDSLLCADSMNEHRPHFK